MSTTGTTASTTRGGTAPTSTARATAIPRRDEVSYVEEALYRERLAEAHRSAERARVVRALRARRRAEVAARRAERLAERADAALAAAVSVGGPVVPA
ncbi:hypothetical protein [Kineococcus indalonis]|uniref:hypothetical protein n=1 Tax=Kineococcus indalonis TaxID=2696566 RepID=UPI0014135BE4|nr:hypothetical protein [Kineococcus indalonis]NAZ87635.1 hypothetical protein [Kineococcus indalonis]